MSMRAAPNGDVLRGAALGAAVGAPLAYALGALFLHLTRMHESAQIGPTAETIDEAFNTVLGGGVGVAVGGAVSALVVRKWLPSVAVGEAVLACAAVDVVLAVTGVFASLGDLIDAALLLLPGLAFAFLGYALGLGFWRMCRRIPPWAARR